MVKLLGSALLVGGLAFLATPASAQKKSAASAPMGGFHHELGVDCAADYAKPSGVSGGIEMGLPVDIRIAFLTRSTLMWEPRLTFSLSSVGGGSTIYTFFPGVNVLYQLKRGSGPRGLLRAPYATGGVGLSVVGFGGSSSTQFALGGGVGTRVPFESAAVRVEGFLSYMFKGGGSPSSFTIGTRIGWSFWH